MRRAELLALALALAAASGSFAARTARAQDDGHDHGVKTEVNLADLSAQQRVAALDAWSHVYCSCEAENWSRTLSNCPDGCARKQKQQILHRVQEGWNLQRIVAEQVAMYGPQAAADPGTSANGSLYVVAGLLLGAGAAGFVLARWRRVAAERRAAAAKARTASPVASGESDAIERELREID